MTTFPQVRLVDAPSPDAAVLFDFNTSWTTTKSVLAPGFTIGTPSVTAAPDAVGVEYGSRTLSFTGRIRGRRSNALQGLTGLARLLLRSQPGWLHVALSPFHKPVWFELLRPQPAALSFEHVFTEDPDSDLWDIDLDLPAQPFAHGERVTLPAVALVNDAANAAGFEIVLPEILGDAPAPLRISVKPSSGSTSSRTQGTSWLMSCMPLKAGTAWAPIVWQIGTSDGFTAGTDTSGPLTDAAFSGGSFREVTFDTDVGLVERLSGPAPTTVAMGRYKVLLRVTRTDTQSTFAFQFGQKVLAYFYDQEPVVMDRDVSTAVGHSTWVDLGDYTFPRSLQRVPAGLEGVPLPAPDISLKVQKLTGTGDCRIDAFKLVPVDLPKDGDSPASTLLTYTPVFGIDAEGLWDGDLEAILAYNDFGRLHPATFYPSGGFPVVVPGAKNVLTVMPHVGGKKLFFGTDNSDVITDVNTVEVSYQPRYLWLSSEAAA